MIRVWRVWIWCNTASSHWWQWNSRGLHLRPCPEVDPDCWRSGGRGQRVAMAGGHGLVWKLFCLLWSHCVDGTAASDIQVLLAEHDYWDSDEPVRMDISEIIMHPEYNSQTVDQDFALLRMANRIDWAANPNIRPACLPEYTAGGTPPTYD